MPALRESQRQFTRALRVSYIAYTVGFLALLLLLGWLERRGLPRQWIGYTFLLVTVILYASIGIFCRTSDAREYYVAGRRVPAVYNGMATAADWMSVASFIGIAGTLYLTGYSGLAYIMGWTGGYVLVALLLAPYLRRFGQYTLPDFMGARYGGQAARLTGVACAVLCSFTYLVAQIYGVGIITSRLTGISFELGIFVALGGMLVCSFLGGMRAVTWTQVSQYIIMLIAYMVPVVWLAVKHADTVVPQTAAVHVMSYVDQLNRELVRDPQEVEVRRLWAARAQSMQARLDALPQSWATERASMRKQLAQMQGTDAPLVDIRLLERELASYPQSVADAHVAWSRARDIYQSRASPPVPQSRPFPAETAQTSQLMQVNFLALVFCLMLGTAGMPHVLTRSYTTTTVGGARRSVFWSLFFIFLLYSMAPALALFVKYEIYTQLVGSSYLNLPDWANAWSAIDPGLLDITDVNRDGIVQLAEISLSADMVVLAMPDIGGLPYVVAALVAIGALAAALSTADGLLLTLSNALSHDMWFRLMAPQTQAGRRVIVSKGLLLVVAFLAAWIAAQRPADILFMVAAAFSFAASSFFPALVMGIFWKRANKWGAISGMMAGVLMTTFYLSINSGFVRYDLLQLAPDAEPFRWFGIEPVAAGVFGAPVAFATMIIVSLLTKKPDTATYDLVDYIRHPGS